jgi:hypothetical protein
VVHVGTPKTYKQRTVPLPEFLLPYLPLDDQLGLPLVVSGDFLTDLSRTHAVVADPTTQPVWTVPRARSRRNCLLPRASWFQQAWDLLTMAGDPRSILASGSNGADHAFMADCANTSTERHCSSPFPQSRSVIAISPRSFPPGRQPPCIAPKPSRPPEHSAQPSVCPRWMWPNNSGRPVRESAPTPSRLRDATPKNL